ncbi:hypothetical protein OD350_28945 (plasmid) [Clostridium beijerinckii]|uniref:hypothetical protein n=1 Tax=Clostridium beijerinckii TaxID=1520 RepID=UPI0022278BEE|nr:hypothetical protein [Clostridium beijerinckii]UYZ39103.1 hypothetical protein OD350_28945 [Clostridium beijerinckii]
MRSIIRTLSLVLILIFSVSLIPTKVNADGEVEISVTPETAMTSKDSMEIYVGTEGVPCYVLYTNTMDNPDVSDMWYEPKGDNVQDWIAPGTTYLHVYVPSTGQWRTTGPYLKEQAPPMAPVFSSVPNGWVNTETTYLIFCGGDYGQTGYDNPNERTSYYESGFDHNEIWRNNQAVAQAVGEQQSLITVTDEGWHEEWARSVDVVGNQTDWVKASFGIDYHYPTITDATATPDDGITVNVSNMQDHDLSGNKQLILEVEKNGISLTSKSTDVTTEGWSGNIPFSSSELGGYSKTATYVINVYTLDNAGNKGLVKVLTLQGDDVSSDTPPGQPPSVPSDPSNPSTDPVPIPVSSVGAIKFDPDSTKWTNKGKTSEGEGKYPVEVYYDGDNPFKATGVATIEKKVKDDKGKTKTKKTKESFDVEFPLESIDVTKDSIDTINGDKGKIYIEKEGYKLKLHGEGHWGAPQYDAPSGATDIQLPTTPANPTGDGGGYNIDWTKPEIKFNVSPKIFSEANGAVRKTSTNGIDDGFYGNITLKDNLSGVQSIAYTWTYGDDGDNDSDSYQTIYTSKKTNTLRSSEVITKEIEKPVGDNLYLHVRAYDVAGNYSYETFGPYEDPIKLTNFQVTDIRDPRWHGVFWDDDTYSNYKNVTFKANQLPIDESSHPTIRNCLPKKGYSFCFDITSEYLYRESDRIEIQPKFYYINGASRIRADAYYDNNNNPLVKIGSTLDNSKLYMDTSKFGNVLIGNFDKLILTKGVRIVKGREWLGGWKDQLQYNDGKIQWWYGKYYIPSSTFFVKAGDSPRPENKLTGGDMLINFEIIAYKNGVETFSTSQIFDYTTSQWGEEGGPKNSTYIKGDTIMYNGAYGIDSDKEISVIH